MKGRQNLVPAYYRLAEDIKKDIESGKFRDGDMLPTEEQLGEKYGISRMTVRRGMAILAEANLIESIPGKGTFVIRPKLNQLVIDLYNCDTGEPFKYKLVNVEIIDNRQKQHELLKSNKIIHLKRLITQNEQVIALEEKWLPYLKGKPILENQLEYADFPEVVASQQDVVPVQNDMQISIHFLSEKQAALLDAEPNSPALLLSQSIYGRNGMRLGTSEIVCHRERFRLKATSYSNLGR